MVLVSVAAPELVHVVLGPEWRATVPVLTVLALAGARETVCSVAGSVMRAKGAGTLIFRYEWLATGTQLAGIVVGLQFGIIGVAVGVTVAGFALMPVLLAIQRRLAGVSIRSQLGRLLPPVHAAAWGALAYLGLRLLLGDSALVILLTGAFSYALVVMVVLWLAHRSALVRVLQTAREVIAPARSPAPLTRRRRTHPSGPLAIVVLTYLRPDDLAELLPLLEQQIATVGHDGCSILVIDNDPAGSAEAVVRRLASAHVRYVHEPAPGIAHARNRALDETVDDALLIFIDDDERPLDGWLAAMLDAYARHRPAGVTGPLFPEYETDPDPWLLAGGFFVRREFPDGHRVPAAGSGNLLLDLRQVRRLGLRFDERFGLTGGSDTMFTRQLIARGGVVVFAPGAGVIDKVPASRMTRHWTLRRQYRVGTTWSRTAVELAPAGTRRLWTRLRLTAGGGARIGVGALRHALGRATGSLTHQARGSRTLRRGLGMAAGAWGGTVTEYQRPAGPTP